MEVSGRTELDNIHETNEQRRQQIILCQPCQSDGDIAEAEGFCETCNEYIRSSFIKAHRKLTVTKNHMIKLKDNMPKSKDKKRDLCSELCTVQKAEIVKYFCEDHANVGCGDCMVLNHKTCSVKLVSDVSDNYNNSKELEQIKEKLGTLERELTSHRDDIENDLKATGEMRERIIIEIKLFRKEINEHLDNAEKDLLKNIEELKSKQVSHLKHIQRQFETMEVEMREYGKKIDQTSDKIHDLFVAAKISHEKLKVCQMSTEKLSYEFDIYKFIKSEDLVTLLTNIYPIGAINAERRGMQTNKKKSLIDAETRLIQSLTVHDSNENKSGWITGMVVLSHVELLLVDHNNYSVKTLNVTENKITSMYTTVGQPRDITSIDSLTFAVTIESKGAVLFINTSNGIRKSHSIKVREQCMGIDHRNGVLAVSFYNPATVQLLNMTDTLLEEFDIKAHCTDPNFIALSNDNKSFFVSDCSLIGNTLLEFSDDGNLKVKISSDDIGLPRGLKMIYDGTVIVCCKVISDRLSIVKPKTREIVPLAAKGVEWPYCVALSDDQSRMFVFDYKDDNVKVFDII